MVNLDELQKLAEQATPGPWVFHFATGEYPATFANVRGEPTVIPNSFSDAQFIAAFNPRTALSLITELRKLRDVNGVMKKGLELLVDDVQGYPAYERPCFALNQAEQALTRAAQIMGVEK